MYKRYHGIIDIFWRRLLMVVLKAVNNPKTNKDTTPIIPPKRFSFSILTKFVFAMIVKKRALPFDPGGVFYSFCL